MTSVGEFSGNEFRVMNTVSNTVISNTNNPNISSSMLKCLRAHSLDKFPVMHIFFRLIFLGTTMEANICCKRCLESILIFSNNIM